MKIFIVCLTTCILLSVSLALAQTIETDFDKNYDLSKLKTFIFSAKVIESSGVLNVKRAMEALQSELTANGYTKSEGSVVPDFIVGCRFQERPVRRSGVQYTEANMVVAFLDGSNNNMIWKGTATDIIDLSKTEKMIGKSVEKLVKEFLKDARRKK
jgi:hypothetical protein